MILELGALVALLNQCQTQVDPSVLKRLIDNESSRNPYAVAVVGAAPVNQPKTKEDAIAIAENLKKDGFSFSLGLMQINDKNFPAYDLTIQDAFDACKNIEVGADIYSKCYIRAKNLTPNKSHKKLLDDAASCYYSGNFLRGYKPEGKNNISYVEKFNKAKKLPPNSQTVIGESYQVEQPKPTQPTKTHSWDVFSDFAY